MFKMNNFLSRFYFLSKLTTSMVLLILLFLLSYLFIKAYLEQNSSSNSSIRIEELSTKLVNLSNVVEKNSSNINIVKDHVLDNKQFVKEIILKVNELKENKINDDVLTQINNLSEENQELKVKLNSLLSTFNNNIVNQLPLRDQQSPMPVKSLINLIRLKLDNGTNFNKEVELLQDLQLNVVQLSSVEKLLILATNNFPGLLKLNVDLDDISSDYLNDYYLKKNKFIKYFTNFVSIKPNLSGDIQDKTVHSLSIAKQNLLDKNLEETINQFSSLSSGEYFFASWIEQAEYYIEVTNILNKLLD